MEVLVVFLAALGVTGFLLFLTWFAGRRFHVVRQLSLTFVLAALTMGLSVYTIWGPGHEPRAELFLEFLLYLFLAVTILGAAGLYLFQVYLVSYRGVRLSPLLHRFVMLIVYAIAVVAALKLAYPDYDLSFFLGAGAVTSVVLGLALQPILTNLFAGIVISLEQPFRINDWIHFGDRDAQVVKITWRTTHLRDRDNDNLVIPNSRIADQELINYYLPNRLHMERIRVGVHYRTPPYRVRQALKQAASRVPGVLEKPSPEVFVYAFDESSIGYELRVWVEDIAALPRTSSQARIEIWEEFKRRDITIPFPIRTLEIEPSARTLEMVRSRSDVDAGGAPKASLFVEDGPDEGRAVRMTPEQPLTVGRDDACGLTLSDRSVSKEHFRIEWTPQGFVLTDLSSRSGTRINGQRCTQATVLQNLDRIQLGDSEVVFESNV